VRVQVLGSAAGGGFPQWNCACSGCDGLRSGAIIAAARTQDSLAVSVDGQVWYLLNASPDIRYQIESCRHLHPRPGAARGSPIAGVVLTNADLDHCLGLFSLREAQPLVICATSAVKKALVEHNVIYRTLERFPGQIHWVELEPGRRVALRTPDGTDIGLSIEAICVPGKAPQYLEGLVAPDPEHNVALLIREARSDRSLVYMPGVGGDAPEVRRLLAAGDLVFFDGTFWSEDELSVLTPGARLAHEMAHWPLAGENGSLEVIRANCRGRCLLTHLNNTNPLLRADSDQRKALLRAGISVAHDGMELLA
jgi:pyrroloquinoline quinone biosynthesis protein B